MMMMMKAAGLSIFGVYDTFKWPGSRSWVWESLFQDFDAFRTVISKEL